VGSPGGSGVDRAVADAAAFSASASTSIGTVCVSNCMSDVSYRCCPSQTSFLSVRGCNSDPEGRIPMAGLTHENGSRGRDGGK
jgi:hypothetical protein